MGEWKDALLEEEERKRCLLLGLFFSSLSFIAVRRPRLASHRDEEKKVFFSASPFLTEMEGCCRKQKRIARAIISHSPLYLRKRSV